MMFQPLVTDTEAATECLNLGRVGESGTPQESQVFVIGVDLTVGRHGDEFAAEWMQAEPVKPMGEARLSGESPVTVVSQNGSLTVTKAFGVTQVIQHKKTRCDRMKAAEGGVWPQRGWQLFDRFESPASRLNFEDFFGRG